MQHDTTPIERAFELSKSGRCTTIDEVFKVLRFEGFSTASLEGPYLRKQLRDLIAAARTRRQKLPSPTKSG